jgi:hypothetical protein
MRDGWIKLHRKIRESAFWNTLNSDQRLVAISLLLMANYEESNWTWKGKKYVCEPGEFITSRAKIASFALVSESSVRSAISRLRRIGPFLTSESTKESTKIKILNWNKYQIDTDGKSETQPTIQPTDQPRPHQDPTTIKKDKKEKKEASRSKTIKMKGVEYETILGGWEPIPGFFFMGEWPEEFWEWAKDKWGVSNEEMDDWYQQFLDWHDKYRDLKKAHFKDWWRRWQDWTKLKANDRGKERPNALPSGYWDPYKTRAFDKSIPLPPGVKKLEDMTRAEMKEKGII